MINLNIKEITEGFFSNETIVIFENGQAVNYIQETNWASVCWLRQKEEFWPVWVMLDGEGDRFFQGITEAEIATEISEYQENFWEKGVSKEINAH
jgi:hypothetical protein